MRRLMSLMVYLCSCVYIDRDSESAMAVCSEIAACVGGLHCSLRQQLGILHPTDLPAEVPQGNPSFRHEKRKFAVPVKKQTARS